MNEDFLNHLSKLRENGKNSIVVTMVNVRGSAPSEIGARIIVGSEGLLFGTIGGGKIEEKSIAHARALLAMDSAHDFVEWNLQTDVGMTCGGVVSLYFEKVRALSDWKIAIFGAGHVAQELVPLLLKLDCDITCIDSRLDWLSRLPDHFKLHKVHSEDMQEVVKTLDPNTFIASMTMGHAYDLPILVEAMTRYKFPYIGVIGSDSKARVLKSDLKKSGVDEKLIANLHCPIGEPFGNNRPVEIAISIVAQLIIVRDQR
ncbi:MAG: xanthine dehydrogenase accessory protein XdhC [Bacteriovorax sp.]